MKKITLFMALILSIPTLAQIKFQFLNAEDAKMLLVAEDATTRQWSTFDCEARLKKKGGTLQELLEFIGAQSLDWTKQEKEKVTEIAEKMNQFIREQQFIIPWEGEIKILKTTLHEEGGAEGYTRKDYIVLKEGMDKHSDSDLSHLLAHELFHILTRNNPDFRKEMYELIGFKIASAPFELPADLREIRITNPDVNEFDSYATFTIRGEKRDCGMVIYASSPYQGGGLFDYLRLGLVPIVDGKIVQKDGNTVIFHLQEAEDFIEKVGENTEYIIDPEEILADNFADVLTNKDPRELGTPELQEKMHELLRRKH